MPQQRAIVLMTTEMGAEQRTAKALKLTENVKKAHVVYGMYDIIALLEAKSS